MKKSSIKISFRIEKSIEMNTSVAQKVYLVNYVGAMMYPSVHANFVLKLNFSSLANGP